MPAKQDLASSHTLTGQDMFWDNSSRNSLQIGPRLTAVLPLTLLLDKIAIGQGLHEGYYSTFVLPWHVGPASQRSITHPKHFWHAGRIELRGPSMSQPAGYIAGDWPEPL